VFSFRTPPSIRDPLVWVIDQHDSRETDGWEGKEKSLEELHFGYDCPINEGRNVRQA
jgi:hypothetical protein